MPLSEGFVTLRRAGNSIRLGANRDLGYTLLRGLAGIGIGPVENITQALPASHGSRLRHTRIGEREIFLPIHIHGEDLQACDLYRDQLHALLDPTKGPVRIEVTSVTRNRETRFVEGWYKEGLEGNYGEQYGGYYQRLGLKFTVPAPFWSKEPVTQLHRLAPAAKPFLSKATSFFPVLLASSVIGGEIPIEVEGDQPVWPTFTITGPGDDPVIERMDTGQSLAYNGYISSGKTLTFDTSKGLVTSPGFTAEQLWPNVSMNSNFFNLPPGPCRLRIKFTGASELSSLTVSYVPQFLTGY